MSQTQLEHNTALWIDENPLSNFDAIQLIRRQGALPRLIQEWILDKELAQIPLEEGIQPNLLSEYRQANNLENEEAYEDHLRNRHLNESLLLKMISRPHQVIRYREDRWGPLASSLYLQNKERFDLVTYNRLEASNANVMQEIYFRLKDGEESWDSLARQFPGAGPEATARKGPVPVAEVESHVLETLRQSQPGQVARPVHLGTQVIVVALEQFQPSNFDEEVRTALLRQAFDDWIAQECSKMLNKIRFPE